MLSNRNTVRLFVALVLVLLRDPRSYSQTFTDSSLSLIGAGSSSVSFGDFNNDGRVDLLVGTTIYRNDGAGSFNAITNLLPAAGEGTVAWGDFNNDGYIDVAIPGGPTRIYRNDGGTNFTPVATLPGAYFCSIAWGDFDDDGAVDLVCSGGQSGTCMFRSDGDGALTDIQSGVLT